MTGPLAPADLVRAVVRNAASLTGGRLLLALVRFAVALVVVQRAGLDVFGQFALLLSFLLIAEWFSDFGLTDIAVRDIAREPQRRAATMGAYALAKVAQCLVAAAGLWAAVALLGYGEEFVHAARIAGLAVLVYGGVQVYRVEFRVRLAMERDVGAEVLAALALLPLVWFATGAGPGTSIAALMLCHVGSRAVNLAAAALLAPGFPRLAFDRELRPALRVLAAATLPLGLTGLLVSAYDAMDAIALARWSTTEEVGIFTIAMRFMMLAVVAEQALAAAVFPVLSRQWQQDREAFARTYQAVLDWGTVLGGALFCALYAGAPVLALLARQDPQAVAAVLQLLAWAVLARAVVTLVSPMVVIADRLRHSVWISLLVVAAKGLALTALAGHGAVGAAAAYLLAEIGVGLVPTVLVCQRSAGLRLNWRVPATILAVVVAVAAAAAWLGREGSVLDGAVALGAYVALAAATGALRPRPLRQLLASLAHRRSHRA